MSCSTCFVTFTVCFTASTSSSSSSSSSESSFSSAATLVAFTGRFPAFAAGATFFCFATTAAAPPPVATTTAAAATASSLAAFLPSRTRADSSTAACTAAGPSLASRSTRELILPEVSRSAEVK